MERIDNPPSGAEIAVTAGHPVQVAFPVENESDYGAQFSLEIAGLPPGENWAVPDPDSGAVTVFAQGTGAVLALIRPPAALAGKTIPLRARVLCDGELDREVSLVFSVGTGAATQAVTTAGAAVASLAVAAAATFAASVAPSAPSPGEQTTDTGDKALEEAAQRERVERAEQRLREHEIADPTREPHGQNAARIAADEQAEKERRLEAHKRVEADRQAMEQARLDVQRAEQERDAARNKAEEIARLKTETQARLDAEAEAAIQAQQEAAIQAAREEQEQQERDRIAREKQEAERKAALEAQARLDRAAQQKRDELAQAAREEAERQRIAEEKAREKERLRQEEEERLRQAAETERLQKEADAKAQAEQQERDRQAREKADAEAAAAAAKAKPRVVNDYTPPTGDRSASTGNTEDKGGGQAVGADANAAPRFTDPVIRNPQETAVYPLKPGGALVVALTIRNDDPAKRALRFSLNLDDATRGDTAKRAMVELIRPELNVDAGAEGELYARIAVPKGADPAVVGIGFLVGPDGRPKPAGLRIRIEPVPAVTLTAAKSDVKTGPLPKGYVDFDLTVGQAGNSDTAFRIAAVDPEIPQTLPGGFPSGANTAVYESGVWRYTLDREVENLKSPGFGRKPDPVKIRLRVERKGAWWWGLKESRALTVRAVPVTDPLNGGQTGNEIKLNAVRARPVPFPPALLLLLFLVLFPIFGGSPSRLTVLNADYDDVRQENGRAQPEYYVVRAAENGEEITANVEWKNPLFVAASLNANAGATARKTGRSKGAVSMTVDRANRHKVTTISALNPLRIGETAIVHLIAARSDTPLSIAASGNVKDKETGARILKVKRSNNGDGITRLVLANVAKTDNRLFIYVIKQPKTYNIDGLTLDGIKNLTISETEYTRRLQTAMQTGNWEVVPREPMQVKIKRNPSVEPREEDLVLATTDAARPIYRIKLVPEENVEP